MAAKIEMPKTKMVILQNSRIYRSNGVSSSTLLCAEISRLHAATFAEHKKHIIQTNSQCISEAFEAIAKLVIVRLFKESPSKKVILSFEPRPEFKFKATFLKEFQPTASG